jgi:hypothetical protein
VSDEAKNVAEAEGVSDEAKDVAEEAPSHETTTSLVGTIPAELVAGSDLPLTVSVSCPSACDLKGLKVEIIAEDGSVVQEAELTEFDGKVNTTDLVVKTPAEPGEHAWEAVFAAQVLNEVPHEESRVPFSFVVKPHRTAMAVWDVPTPVAAEESFAIKAGVQCLPQKCVLTGAQVEIVDEQGATVATAVLSEEPWQATDSLYWAEIDIQAPATLGLRQWSVKFPGDDVEVAHEGAEYGFAFAVAASPDHTVTVEAKDEDNGGPIEDAHVTLMAKTGFPYRARTGADGMASLSVPSAEYTLWINHDSYKSFETTLDVSDDVSVTGELTFVPDMGV